MVYKVRDFTAGGGQFDEFKVNLQTRSVKMLTMFTKTALKCDFPERTYMKVTDAKLAVNW